MSKKFQVPKTLGACADALYKLKEQKTDLNRQITAIEEQEKLVKEHLIQNLPKDDARGVMGKLSKASIVTKVIPTANDWDAFYKYVLKKKDFSLMQRRLSEGAIRERWEAGEKLPGVEPFNVVTVSVTKL